MLQFQDKTVIITGAGSGIGLAAAKLFAAQGAHVVLAAHSKAAGRQAEDQVPGSRFVLYEALREEDAGNLVREAVESFGGIDVLFNNAGYFPPSREIDRMPLEDWERAFDVNVKGYFLLCRQARPWLVKSQGNIINNASIAGMHSYVIGRSYAYSASKAAVIQFSRQMAKNYAPEGVRVNCICPGIVDTKMLGDRDRTMYAARVPLGRLAAPQEVAKVVLFLAGENASYLTGTVIPVDGGVSL